MVRRVGMRGVIGSRLGTLRTVSALAGALVLGGCADLSTDLSRRPESIRLDPPSLTLTEGDTTVVGVEVRSESGELLEIPAWAPPRWASADGDVLQTSGGSVAAVGPGEAWAEVTFAGLRTTLNARVHPATLPIAVTAYVTQAIQRPDGGVPLVAGRDALLRVFVTTERTNFFTIRGTARLYAGEEEVHAAPLALENESIPDRMIEFSLGQSLNAVIPGEVLQPGVSLVIELDRDQELPITTDRRYPATGKAPLDVLNAPPLELRLVPVRHPHRSEPVLTGAAIDDAMSLTRKAFPLGDIELEVREVYQTDQDLTTEAGWSGLLREVRLLRDVDGSDAYHYGILDLPPVSPYGGIAYLGARVSVGSENPGTVAHELGHNFSLPHAPCGVSGDRNFPHANASIGFYGYDTETGELKSPRDYVDLMSYCVPEWISDYNYRRVGAFREANDWPLAAGTPHDHAGDGPATAREPTLVVWGRVTPAGVELDPALVLDMPPRPAPADGEAGGAYRVRGYDGLDTELFDVAFQPWETSTAGESSFVVAVPAAVAVPDRLERLVVTGPAGSAERRAAASGPAEIRLAPAGVGRVAARWRPGDHRLAAVVDRATGRLLALDRDGSLSLPATAAAGVDILVSDGVRTRPAMVRR